MVPKEIFIGKPFFVRQIAWKLGQSESETVRTAFMDYAKSISLVTEKVRSKSTLTIIAEITDSSQACASCLLMVDRPYNEKTCSYVPFYMCGSVGGKGTQLLKDSFYKWIS